MACSECTTIPAGHLKFMPVETKGVAYTGTVQTDANVCEWAFIPRGLYTCHRGKTSIAVFNPTDDVISIPPRKILVQVSPVEERDMVQSAGDVGHVAEPKVFTRKEKEQFVKRILRLDKHPVLKHRPDLHKRVVRIFVDNFSVLVTREGECGKTDLVSMKIDVKPGSKPVRQNPRPMAPPVKEEFRK